MIRAIVGIITRCSIVAVALAGCEASSPDGGTPRSGGDSSALPFVDVATERGVHFRHDNGARGERVLPETMGGGGGFLDFDLDGDFDLVLVDGGVLGGGEPRPPNRLLENDGTGHFTDVTEGAGMGDTEHGMGVAVGDVDNDGDPDLYFANFGPNALYLNRGDGTFEWATPEAAILPTWSSSATFLDFDGDGALDLYVVSYLDVDLETHHPCLRDGIPSYCAPRDYPPQVDHLLRGDGHGGFSDISEAVGIRDTGGTGGRGLGVVASDLDDDGDDDLYIANDMDLNFLFRNTRDEGTARFREEAVLFGSSASEDGRPQAGMGIDSGDFDGDGDFDLIVTNFEEQSNALYRNEEKVSMLEVSYHFGMGSTTLPFLAFGVRFLDFDLDADLDLFVANGHVFDNARELRQGSKWAQEDQLFENRSGRFVEVLAPAIAAGAIPIRVGRAAASGDFDSDGDLDLLVVNNGDTAVLLENRTSAAPPRLGLRLEGVPPSNRDAYGAKVTVEAAGRKQVFEVRAGSSYLSSHDPRLIVAIPGAASARVTIRWPSGRVETLEAVAAGGYHHIVEGDGIRGTTPFR